jgi:HWE histidine kinase
VSALKLAQGKGPGCRSPKRSPFSRAQLRGRVLLRPPEQPQRSREDRLATVSLESSSTALGTPLTVVSAIADNTMRKSDTFADFAASYRDRLQALGRVQGLLFRQQRGDRVTFDELIEAELVAQSINGGEVDGSRSTDREAFG